MPVIKFASVEYSQVSEDEDGYPHLKRNVMINVETEKEEVTIEKKAARIEDKILRDDEIFDFRLFVDEGFRKLLRNEATGPPGCPVSLMNTNIVLGILFS